MFHRALLSRLHGEGDDRSRKEASGGGDGLLRYGILSPMIDRKEPGGEYFIKRKDMNQMQLRDNTERDGIMDETAPAAQRTYGVTYLTKTDHRDLAGGRDGGRKRIRDFVNRKAV